MEFKNTLSARSFITALCASLLFVSCDNNDTNKTEETTETITDTTQTTVVTPADTMMTDTSTVMTTTKPGIAKPNPAKKGLKGKVTAKAEMPASKNAKM